MDPPNPDTDTVNFGLRIVFHEGASLSRRTTPRLPSPRFEMLSFSPERTRDSAKGRATACLSSDAWLMNTSHFFNLKLSSRRRVQFLLYMAPYKRKEGAAAVVRPFDNPTALTLLL